MIAQISSAVNAQHLIEQIIGIELIPLESAAYYNLKGKLYPCIIYSYSVTIEEHQIEVQYGIEIPKQNIPYCYRNNESFHEFVSIESVALLA